MAYIRYRNGKFFVEIRRQGINPIYSSFIKKSDAKKFALQKEVEIQQKRYKDTSLASKILLRDLIVEEKAKLKSNHRNSYKYNNLLKYSVCNKSLLELTSFDFAHYRDKRLSEGVQGGTVNRELSLISKTIKKAISEKNVYIPEFPITSFIRAKENPPKERRLYKGELEKILSEAQQFKNNYIVPCIIFAIETGMRLSEQTNLKWKDIDLDKAILINGISIKPRLREVKVDGQVIDNLTFSEFQILYLLAGHPGWVFTRYQIIDKIRGDNYPVTDRSVDFQIVGLRKKLGDAGKLIRTVRGVGYRFTPDEK